MKKICVLGIVIMLGAFNAIVFFSSPVNADENQPQWPTSWYTMDIDPTENGPSDDYRDVHYANYSTDNNYLYFRLECYGYPNFTLEPDCRYKWYIDIDGPHDMGTSGGNVFSAEYMLFVEDSPKPGGDGIGDVYLLYDTNDDSLFDEWDDYLNNPGPILNSSVAGYRIDGKSIDLYIRLANITNPTSLYFTWATDQENPNLDQAPDIDRSNNYWDENLEKADLYINKTDSVNFVYPGESFKYILQVTNYGPHDAINVNVTDVLPTELYFDSANPPESGSNDQTSTYWWNIPSLEVGESITIEIYVTVKSSASPGVIENIAYAYNDTRDPTPGNNEDHEYTTINERSADISITKADSIDPAYIGQPLKYTLKVTNNGPDDSYNVNVTDTLPDEVNFDSANPAPDGNIDSTYWWIMPSIYAGEVKEIEINVIVNSSISPGVITNNAIAYNETLDPILENNICSNQTVIETCADLNISKLGSASSVYPGDELTYTINVTNLGPNDAINVNVSDSLPSELVFKSANPQQNGSSDSKYWWIIPLLNTSESEIIKINVGVKNDAGEGTVLNFAQAYSDIYDPISENNEDTIETAIMIKDTPPGGGGGGGGFPSPSGNKPTADAGGPYYGLIDEEINFNGTGSHDNDEGGQKIQRYDWKFYEGDEWHKDIGATPTYIYSEIGEYNITLRVYDDEDSYDINTTIAMISLFNHPPQNLNIIGPVKGHQNTSYYYDISAIDLDDHEITYTVEWDDGISETSEPVPNGTVFTANHLWTAPGEYTIIVSAVDELDASGAAVSLDVLIDIHYVKDLGYLIDNDSDGTYDTFYSNQTGEVTKSEQQDDGRYLINSDEDDNWDWIYDPEDDTLEPYFDEAKAEDNFLWLLLLLIIILGFIALLLFLAKRKKDKEKGGKPNGKM